MKIVLHLFMLLFVVVPCGVEAAITITEVAWMGDSNSANNEWIELHNSGDVDVDVSDWRFTDEQKIDLTLSGIITAGSFVVLERTDDDSAPGTAFAIYTGALANTGSTLRIYRADGSLVDQVAGSENWENIGGDNVTKETAQYTTGGWITAAATPGSENKTLTNSTVGSEDSHSANNVTSDKKSTTVTSLQLPDASLALSIDAPTVGYVRQPITFMVTDKGLGKTLSKSLQYTWNFGNAHGAKGREVEYAYHYPGTYIIYVEGAYARHEELARHEVTILPVIFSVTKSPAGDVQLHNDSPYEIDISGYRLVGQSIVSFPAYSHLAANGTITIPIEDVGTGPLYLIDPTDTVISLTNKAVDANEVNEVADKPILSVYDNNTESTHVHKTGSVISARPATVTVSSSAADINSKEGTPYVFFIGFMISVVGILFFTRSKGDREID